MLEQESKDNLLNEVYGGNEKAMKKAIAKGLHKTMFWQHIEADTKVLPELEEKRENLFRIILGYLPPKHFTVKYDAFIKVAIMRYRDGLIDYDSFIDEVRSYIATIRNRELSPHNEEYKDSELALYESYLPEFKETAYKRMCKVLGYKPEIKTSLYAELMYRDVLAFRPDTLDDKVCSVDMQAATITKYRERLLTYGVEEAKVMDFIAPPIMERYNKGEIVF